MKRYSGLIAFGLAIGFGLMAVVLAHKWLAARNSEARIIVNKTAPVTQIVVAAADLQIGTPLSKKNLVLAEWPMGSEPRGAFNDIGAVEGRVAVTQLTAGEPVLAAELAAPGSGAGMVAMINPGMRAMAVQVDEVTGVGGFVLPNTFVDIIGVESQKRGKEKAKTILKKIKVLAIAQETFTEEGRAKVVRTVTMELEPKQTETLALQTHKGAIHLVLRNPLDVEEPKPEVKKASPKRRVASLKPRVRTPKPSPHAVEIIRGSKPSETVQFKNVNSEKRL